MRGLYLIAWLLAMFAGLGMGLFVAWYLVPLRYSNAQPWDLGAAEKDDYLRMIASSYALDNDLRRAIERMYYLQLPDARSHLAALAREEVNPLTQQALLKLWVDLRQPDIALARPTSTPRPTRDTSPKVRVTVIVLEPTAPLPTASSVTRPPTPLPPTSEPNPNAPRFELKEKRALDCTALAGKRVIQVIVQDAAGNGLPGIAIEVSSEHGNELFFTGLKPEKGAGFADVEVLPGTYSVHLVENAQSEPISDLRIDVVECAYTPAATQGWLLVFQQAQ